jgi:cytoskeleton protein RodZ
MMTSIGEQLKNARQERGVSLEQVADDTNIARRYLEALETENFSVFPGEPYILGFLRNYADYLGLEPQSLINAFRGIRIQEQPVPIDALLHDKKKLNVPLIIIVALSILGAIAALVVWNSGILSPRQNLQPIEVREPISHTLTSTSMEQRFYPGDTLNLSYRKNTYTLKIVRITDRVAIDTPAGVLQFMMAEEGTIDLDRDNLPELKLFVRDFERNKPESGVLLRISATASLLAEGTLNPGEQHDSSESASLDPQAFVDTAAASTAQKIIFSGKRSPHPFVLNITFRNQAMFRHEIDRREREERFYFRGDEITATATNTAKLWTSNAAATRLIIQASGSQSVEVELGSPGQVTVKQLRWTQSEDGTWSLSLFDVN